MLIGTLMSTALLGTPGPTWPPAGTAPPALLFGPLAHHPSNGQTKAVGNETVALLAGNSGNWTEVRKRIVSSGGALHTSVYAWGAPFTTRDAQRQLASLMHQQGLSLSVEAGSGFCGVGSGARAAATNLERLATYFASGGKVRFWQLASSFSRTHVNCPNQTFDVTVNEASSYAAAVQSALPRAELFLYDALPHYSVGNKWPANKDMGLELGSVLSQLQKAMAANGVKLHGYWADCPFEYSDQYPFGDGYKKVAAAAGLASTMGLKFGKTFNAAQAGQNSSADFYAQTLADFVKTSAEVPSAASNSASLSYAMVASWYLYPTLSAPEGMPYTETNTARAVFRQIRPH